MDTPIDATSFERSFLEILLQGGPLFFFGIVVSTALAIAFAVRITRRRLHQGHYAPSIGDAMLFIGVIALMAFVLGSTLTGTVAALSAKGIDADWAIIFSVEEASTGALIGGVQIITMLLAAFIASATSRKRKTELSSPSNGHPAT